jgi:hypothetical protein
VTEEFYSLYKIPKIFQTTFVYIDIIIFMIQLESEVDLLKGSSASLKSTRSYVKEYTPKGGNKKIIIGGSLVIVFAVLTSLAIILYGKIPYVKSINIYLPQSDNSNIPGNFKIDTPKPSMTASFVVIANVLIESQNYASIPIRNINISIYLGASDLPFIGRSFTDNLLVTSRSTTVFNAQVQCQLDENLIGSPATKYVFDSCGGTGNFLGSFKVYYTVFIDVLFKTNVLAEEGFYLVPCPLNLGDPSAIKNFASDNLPAVIDELEEIVNDMDTLNEIASKAVDQVSSISSDDINDISNSVQDYVSDNGDQIKNLTGKIGLDDVENVISGITGSQDIQNGVNVALSGLDPSVLSQLSGLF